MLIGNGVIVRVSLNSREKQRYQVWRRGVIYSFHYALEPAVEYGKRLSVWIREKGIRHADTLWENGSLD